LLQLGFCFTVVIKELAQNKLAGAATVRQRVSFVIFYGMLDWFAGLHGGSPIIGLHGK
jgi:hypothetical protein